MKYALILLVYIFSFMSCDFQPNGDNVEGVNSEIDISGQNVNNQNNLLVLEDSLLLKYDSISMDSYTLRVKSFFYQEMANYKNGDIDKVVKRQVLVFLNGDSILNSLVHHVKRINVSRSRKKDIHIQENNFYKICVVAGKKDWLFYVKGRGILDSQTEYYGLYTKQGTMLWYSYTSYQNFHKVQPEIPDEGFGNMDRILLEYGITELEFRKPTFCKDILL